MVIFCLLTSSVESVYNQGLNFAKFLLPPGLVYNCFVASEQKLFSGQFFFLPDSLEPVSEPGA